MTTALVTTPRQSLTAGRIISGKDPTGCRTSFEIPINARHCRRASSAKLIKYRFFLSVVADNDDSWRLLFGDGEEETGDRSGEREHRRGEQLREAGDLA
jgi:hypothetical protein